ncbi:DUF6328 family protein [Streptomyces sp. NPDC058579]|uniref:DUF6328 family protein n=1 Tax=Streptomyces sp. NPDC058579 TaxID=3346548 RepID=UPI00364C890B
MPETHEMFPAIAAAPPVTYLPQPGESRAARLDRAYAELLQEVRIAQCGIQILFASLLYLGVAPAFAGATAAERALYCVSLAASIGAAGALLAPAAVHRFMWDHRVKDDLVRSAHRCLVTGLSFLALALTSALALILNMALGPLEASVGGTVALSWFATLWWLGPARRRRARRRG